jgi:beta-lactamase regulating signal transducer with metallopeptidase domain
MTHTLESIAWTLIDFCWQAAAIAILYRMVSPVLARHSSHARYLLALVAMLAMTAAAAVTFTWQMQSTTPSRVLVTTASGIESAIGDSVFPEHTAPGLIPSHSAAGSGPRVSYLKWNDLLQCVDAFWVLGVLALSMRSLGGWWLIRRLRTSATAELPAAARNSFVRIAAALGLRRPVLLRVSGAIAGPVTVGALRAMVLLPLSAVTSLGPDELEVVLAHELAHVRRADYFVNLLQTLAETLFFFHPAVWWISGRIRHERELCCDDLALRVCPNPVIYAHALFRLEEQRIHQWRLAMALDGHQSPQALRLRIARILGEPAARRSNPPIQPFSIVAAIVAVSVLLVSAPQLVAGLHQVQPAASVSAFKSVAPSPDSTRPAVAAVVGPLAVRALRPLLQAATPEPQTKSDVSEPPKSSYIDRMKAAGYDVDLDTLMAMKIQDVTPEYARAMSQVGFGKPSAEELIACKIQGVSPEVIAQFKQQGLEVKSLHDAIAFRIFAVTPDFAAGMKAAGFSGLTSEMLLSLRVQGVTPEYARQITQQFPGATVDDVIKTRIFRIDPSFVELAKKHGFNDLSLEKLVQLRISGLFDDESSKP